jgi:hypothetical protein
MKSSKGASEASRALKIIARYSAFNDIIMEGRALSLLPSFGMMRLRAASEREVVLVSLAWG